MINNSRELAGVGEKRNQIDFALWKRAMPEHIMRWPSPWSNGFPGWHCECTAMGRKYLGDYFDIHGGGMDLIFPHHECEIAQAVASQGDEMVKYWMHNNMITINGQKMGKSLGNFITLEQFFTGEHDTLTQAYSPMTIRFFILSAHYRGTVDFSNEALQAAEKGYERLMNGIEDLARIQTAAASDENTKKFVAGFRQKCYDAMNDDLMTPAVISTLFEACHLVNILIDHKRRFQPTTLRNLQRQCSSLPSISSVFRMSVEPITMLVRRLTARWLIWYSTFVQRQKQRRIGLLATRFVMLLLRLASRLRTPRTVLRGNLTDKVQVLSVPNSVKGNPLKLAWCEWWILLSPVNINKTKDSYSSVVPVMRFTIHGIAVLLLFLSCQVDMPLPKNSTLSRKLKA